MTAIQQTQEFRRAQAPLVFARCALKLFPVRSCTITSLRSDAKSSNTRPRWSGSSARNGRKKRARVSVAGTFTRNWAGSYPRPLQERKLISACLVGGSQLKRQQCHEK